MIEVVVNDRLGKKVRVKCNEDDTIGDLKKLVAALTGVSNPSLHILAAVHSFSCTLPGTKPEKIRLQKWHNIFKDHITLDDCK